MTRQPAYSYRSEISERTMQRARRRIERREQARPIDTLDVGCRYCMATYTLGETHHCEDDEHWGPVKIGTVVVFALGFIYAIVTIAAVLG